MDDMVEVNSSGIVVNDHCEDDESMEDVEAVMDWEPLPLRRSPRLAALRESLSLRPLRRSPRLAALCNGHLL